MNKKYVLDFSSWLAESKRNSFDSYLNEGVSLSSPMKSQMDRFIQMYASGAESKFNSDLDSTGKTLLNKFKSSDFMKYLDKTLDTLGLGENSTQQIQDGILDTVTGLKTASKMYDEDRSAWMEKAYPNELTFESIDSFVQAYRNYGIPNKRKSGGYTKLEIQHGLNPNGKHSKTSQMSKDAMIMLLGTELEESPTYSYIYRRVGRCFAYSRVLKETKQALEFESLLFSLLKEVSKNPKELQKFPKEVASIVRYKSLEDLAIKEKSNVKYNTFTEYDEKRGYDNFYLTHGSYFEYSLLVKNIVNDVNDIGLISTGILKLLSNITDPSEI